MKLFDNMKVLQTLCRLSKKPGMYINFDGALGLAEETGKNSVHELWKAAPYLKEMYTNDSSNVSQILSEGIAYFLFDSYKEMEKTFQLTVGDEGPTKLNKYKGPCRVYAITCNAKGVLQESNT